MQGRMQEAEELFRVSLTTLDFLEDTPTCPHQLLAKDVNLELGNLLVETDRFEEAGPFVQRLHQLSEEEPDSKDFKARLLAVRFHLRRGDTAQANKEAQVLPSLKFSRFS